MSDKPREWTIVNKTVVSGPTTDGVLTRVVSYSAYETAIRERDEAREHVANLKREYSAVNLQLDEARVKLQKAKAEFERDYQACLDDRARIYHAGIAERTKSAKLREALKMIDHTIIRPESSTAAALMLAKIERLCDEAIAEYESDGK